MTEQQAKRMIELLEQIASSLQEGGTIYDLIDSIETEMPRPKIDQGTDFPPLVGKRPKRR